MNGDRPSTCRSVSVIVCVMYADVGRVRYLLAFPGVVASPVLRVTAGLADG